MRVKSGGRFFEIDVKKSNGIRGLVFRSREKAPALLFETKNSLHSFFVFFPFVVLWIDDKNNVVDYKLVKPFKFYINSGKKFNKIVEIPINKKYKPLLVALLMR